MWSSLSINIISATAVAIFFQSVYLRYHITAVGRKYKVVAHIVPTTFDDKSKDALREIEGINNLPANSIEHAK